MIAMNTLKFRLLKACAVATDFVRGRLKMKKIAKNADPTQVLLSTIHEPYANQVLFNIDGTMKGKPYRKQEDVRKIEVDDFTDAYLMFCALGDPGTGACNNCCGYGLCIIDDSVNGLHFEMLVKPRRFPANTIATMTVTSISGNPFPIRTVYFTRKKNSTT